MVRRDQREVTYSGGLACHFIGACLLILTEFTLGQDACSKVRDLAVHEIVKHFGVTAVQFCSFNTWLKGGIPRANPPWPRVFVMAGVKGAQVRGHVRL